jgi:hypothetical protein
MSWLFSPDYLRRSGRVHRLPTLHASIDGNAIWSGLVLGISDERTQPLVQRLLETQWPDGGWNCDRRPAAGPPRSPRAWSRCLRLPCRQQ